VGETIVAVFCSTTKLCSHTYLGISLSRRDIVAHGTRANASYDGVFAPFVFYRDEDSPAFLANESIVAFLTSWDKATP